MPVLHPIVVSPELREAAALKIEELERFKASLADRFRDRVEDDSRVAVLERLASLVDGLKKFDPLVLLDDSPAMWIRRVEQAENDKSITGEKLAKLETDLRTKLGQHLARLDISSLHVTLLEEILHASDKHEAPTYRLDELSLEDGFELVEEELDSAYAAFEEHAFANKDIDVKAIEEYIAGLYTNGTAHIQLDSIRAQMKRHGRDIMSGRYQIDEDIVEGCIRDLLENELLSQDKKTTLQRYLHSPAALREITDTLSVKPIYDWAWHNGDNGLPVIAQQNAEGKQCITVQASMLDMLFMHCLALVWSTKLRECLSSVVWSHDVWPGAGSLTKEEHQRRDFYLQGQPSPSSSWAAGYGAPLGPAAPMTTAPYLPPPPGISNIPSRYKSVLPTAPRFKTKKSRSSSYMVPPPPVYFPPSTLNDERTRVYFYDHFLRRLPKEETYPAVRLSDAQIQANLLKTLVLESKIRKAFGSGVHGISANFKSFAPSLPHETILTVLGFLGVSDDWLEVFKRFLTAPLNTGPGFRGTSDQIRNRTSGVPVSHGLETFFGEAILSFLDLVVHRMTHSYLFRLRDRCYFIGDEKKCASARDEIANFARIMGLDVTIKNLFDGESVGFVTFDGKAENDAGYAIDLAKVASYARRIKKQLSVCSGALEWVRNWNATIGTYSPHLFGPLVNVFGKSHLEAVTQAYTIMYDIIFDGTTLTEHVLRLLPATAPTTIGEEFVHLPVEYGGLGVKNPYVTLNLARNMPDDPDSQLAKYLQDEKKYYELAAARFHALTTQQRQTKLKALFDNDEERIVAALGTDSKTVAIAPEFPSLEVLTASRESTSLFSYTNPFAYPGGAPIAMPPITPVPHLVTTYSTLAYEPTAPPLNASTRVLDEVSKLADRSEYMPPWEDMSSEEKWAVGLYGEDCIEKFGGLEVWRGEWVPRELIWAVRGEEGRVGVGMADDGSSAGSSL